MIAVSTGSRMKAVAYDRPGTPDILKLKDVDRPVVPDDGC